MRLLMDWVQFHPGIQRIEAHSAQAAGTDNSELGRPFTPSHMIEIDKLNDRMEANPPTSVNEMLELVCAEITDQTSFTCAVQEQRVPIEPPVHDEPAPPTEA